MGILHWIAFWQCYCLSMESIRLGGPAHGIVTKNIHKILQGGGWDLEVKGPRGGRGSG